MANKSGSRALVNYFCLDYPILSQNREDIFQNTGTVLLAYAYFTSNTHLTSPHFTSPPVVTVEDLDEQHFLDLETKSSSMTNLSMNFHSTSSTPWKFLYYHRSGFLKDTHEMWILFSVDGYSLQGRGVDDIGPFFVKGLAESGFDQCTWYLDKFYLQTTFLDNLLEPLSIWVQNTENVWLDDDEFFSFGRKSVSHVAYRSSQTLPPLPPLLVESCRSSSQNLNREEGFWGVWETASVGSHYELQKGGVFRAIHLL